MGRIPVYLLILTLIASAFPRCAQIVAPTGGAKDTLPPNLISAVPPDSTLQFKNKTITLNFDEFVQVEDLQKQLIIAPNPARQPTITAKLRSVSIKWNDSLKSNTTYTINMGDAIQDINENNPFKNFRYVFSTGTYLDSLQITGKLVDAMTGLPDSNVAVMLYDHMEDSVVSKEGPVYYTRSIGDGSFALQNLPHDTFKLFILNDANGDLQYNDSTEAIAFREAPILLDSNLTQLRFYLFKEKATKDSTKVAVADTTKKNTKLNFSVQLDNGHQDLNEPLTIHFGTRLQQADSTKLLLQEDTTLSPVKFTFTEDTTKQTIFLHYAWKENMPYRLILDSTFVMDTSGLTIAKMDTTKFITKSLSDYGTLALHFVDVDTVPHFVVQLVQDDEVIFSSPLVKNVWKKYFLDPGDYQIRILKDDNGNGHWDPGCYYCTEKKQPEQVISLPQKFNVKANWDNDKTDLKFSFEE